MNRAEETQKRLRQNLVNLACGRDNWQLVLAFAETAVGDFTTEQVVESDERAEWPYVVVALALLVERGVLEKVQNENRRRDCGGSYRKADSSGV